MNKSSVKIATTNRRTYVANRENSQIKAIRGRYFVLTFLLLLLLQTSFSSCSSKQQSMQRTANAAPIITYEKERSRGNRLPLYTIEVLENKMVRYTGKANVAHIGERLIELEKGAYHTLVNQFKAADFNNFDTSYKGKLRDLPLTSLTYEGHKVTYQEIACPKSLKKLVVLVEGLVEE